MSLTNEEAINSFLKFLEDDILRIFENPTATFRLERVSNFIDRKNIIYYPEYRDFLENYSIRDVDAIFTDTIKADLLSSDSVIKLVTYCTDIISNESHIFRSERNDLINESFFSYKSGCYPSCASLLFAQIEGVISDFILYNEVGIKPDRLPKNMHDKNIRINGYSQNIEINPFDIYKSTMNERIKDSRNELFHNGIIKDPKLKSFLLYITLLTTISKIRYLSKNIN